MGDRFPEYELSQYKKSTPTSLYLISMDVTRVLWNSLEDRGGYTLTATWIRSSTTITMMEKTIGS